MSEKIVALHGNYGEHAARDGYDRQSAEKTPHVRRVPKNAEPDD